MGPLRPTKSLSGYRTPVEHLWHTAAGAHPMGALNGWSGRTTARMVNRLLKREGVAASGAGSGSAASSASAPMPSDRTAQERSVNGSQPHPVAHA